MNSYEAKQAARKARLEERAERADEKANALLNRGRQMAEAIPFGQPILVGHHSEGRDRRYRARIGATFDKGLAEHKKAQELAGRAESVGKGGISSDDPDAPDKLREKLATLEAAQARMVAINKAWRTYRKAPESAATMKALAALPETDQARVRAYVPEYSWEKGPAASFELSNNSANIRRIKQRIEHLEQQAARAPAPDIEGDGWRIVENVEDNRLQIVFDDKPPAEVRSRLKSAGFRWSPTAGAWQRQLSNGARWAAKSALGIS